MYEFFLAKYINARLEFGFLFVKITNWSWGIWPEGVGGLPDVFKLSVILGYARRGAFTKFSVLIPGSHPRWLLFHQPGTAVNPIFCSFDPGASPSCSSVRSIHVWPPLVPTFPGANLIWPLASWKLLFGSPGMKASLFSVPSALCQFRPQSNEFHQDAGLTAPTMPPLQ